MVTISFLARDFTIMLYIFLICWEFADISTVCMQDYSNQVKILTHIGENNAIPSNDYVSKETTHYGVKHFVTTIRLF